MGAPEAIRIGPFVGGLNTASDSTAVKDEDLVECVNFELDLDGALVNRQPLIDTGVTMPMPTGGYIKLLGYFSTALGSDYLIASDSVNSTYYFDGTSWQLITDQVAAAAMTQYRDKAWLVAPADSGQPGGSWEPSIGFATVPGMPEGSTIVVNKERLWIGPGPEKNTNGARLSYCAVGEPNKWPNSDPSGGGYINVNGGDGQNIFELKVHYSDIIIFKSNSIYRFVFSTDPANGILSRVSDTIGIAAPNCVVSYEGSLYIMYRDNIYSITNYNFTVVNAKAPLVAKTPTTSLAHVFGLSVWNDRLIANYYDTTYVLNLRTNAWCTWDSTVVGTIGPAYEKPSRQGEYTMAYLVSSISESPSLYKVTSETNTDSEVMKCRIKTKNYDYQSSHTFKKIAQWGADVIARDKIVGTMMPIIFNLPVTWQQVSEHTWQELGTWNNLLGMTHEVIDPISIGGSTNERKYIRFNKVLRFRQVFFTLEFDTDGSITSAPVKLFTLTTFVGSKQSVPARIN